MTTYNLTLVFADKSDVTDFMRTVNFGLNNIQYLHQIFDILDLEIPEDDNYIGSAMINDISLISLAAAEEPYVDETYINCAKIIDVVENNTSVMFTIQSSFDLTRFITRLMKVSDIVDYSIAEGVVDDA